MCNILKPAGRRTKQIKICDFVCGVLFGSGHLSSVWGHSVHFAKFLILSFSSLSHSFHLISTKLYRKDVYWGKYKLLLFLAIYHILKVYTTFKTSYLRYIDIIHKTMLVSSSERPRRTSRPMGRLFLLFYFFIFVNMEPHGRKKYSNDISSISYGEFPRWSTSPRSILLLYWGIALRSSPRAR